MVFQRPVLLRRSVWENLAFVLKGRGIGGEQADEMIRRALSPCSLSPVCAPFSGV